MWSNNYLLLKQQIDAVVSKYDERFASHAEALKVALAASEKRLDSMNEFRKALSDQTFHLITRNEVTSLVAPIHEKIDTNAKPNYTVLGSFFSLLAGALAGIWLILGLKIENTNTPLALQIAQIRSTQITNVERITLLSAEIEQSKSDRIKVVNDLEIKQVELEGQINALKDKLNK